MKTKVAILLISCLSGTTCKAYGHVSPTDSVHQKEVPAYLLPAIGGGIVVAGSLLKSDHGGRAQGIGFKPSFDYKADEVLRFVPAAALVGMKAFGVKNRTEKWSELIVRSAASTAIMGLTVESTKRLVGRVRPDGSDDRSFPSGHSATAFLTASLFAKEYGHLSPWYSVGAYGVATSTAMLRRMGDHHWMSDVMVGAGIGILSVELGYALADIYYKGKPGIAESAIEPPSSTAGVYMSYVLPHAISGTCGNHRVRSRFGYGAGMEATHFITPYIGIGGRMGISSSQMEIVESNGRQTICQSPLDHVSLAAGPRLRWPLSTRFQAGIYMSGGYGFYPRTDLGLSDTENYSLGNSSGWGYEGGVSFSYFTRQGVSIRLMADYQSWSAPSPGFDNQGFSFGLSAGWGW